MSNSGQLNQLPDALEAPKTDETRVNYDRKNKDFRKDMDDSEENSRRKRQAIDAGGKNEGRSDKAGAYFGAIEEGKEEGGDVPMQMEEEEAQGGKAGDPTSKWEPVLARTVETATAHGEASRREGRTDDGAGQKEKNTKKLQKGSAMAKGSRENSDEEWHTWENEWISTAAAGEGERAAVCPEGLKGSEVDGEVAATTTDTGKKGGTGEEGGQGRSELAARLPDEEAKDRRLRGLKGSEVDGEAAATTTDTGKKGGTGEEGGQGRNELAARLPDEEAKEAKDRRLRYMGKRVEGWLLKSDGRSVRDNDTLNLIAKAMEEHSDEVYDLFEEIVPDYEGGPLNTVALKALPIALLTILRRDMRKNMPESGGNEPRDKERKRQKVFEALKRTGEHSDTLRLIEEAMVTYQDEIHELLEQLGDDHFPLDEAVLRALPLTLRRIKREGARDRVTRMLSQPEGRSLQDEYTLKLMDDAQVYHQGEVDDLMEEIIIHDGRGSLNEVALAALPTALREILNRTQSGGIKERERERKRQRVLAAMERKEEYRDTKRLIDEAMVNHQSEIYGLLEGIGDDKMGPLKEDAMQALPTFLQLLLQEDENEEEDEGGDVDDYEATDSNLQGHTEADDGDGGDGGEEGEWPETTPDELAGGGGGDGEEEAGEGRSVPGEQRGGTNGGKGGVHQVNELINTLRKQWVPKEGNDKQSQGQGEGSRSDDMAGEGAGTGGTERGQERAASSGRGAAAKTGTSAAGPPKAAAEELRLGKEREREGQEARDKAVREVMLEVDGGVGEEGDIGMDGDRAGSGPGEASGGENRGGKGVKGAAHKGSILRFLSDQGKRLQRLTADQANRDRMDSEDAAMRSLGRNPGKTAEEIQLYVEGRLASGETGTQVFENWNLAHSEAVRAMVDSGKHWEALHRANGGAPPFPDHFGKAGEHKYKDGEEAAICLRGVSRQYIRGREYLKADFERETGLQIVSEEDISFDKRPSPSNKAYEECGVHMAIIWDQAKMEELWRKRYVVLKGLKVRLYTDCPSVETTVEVKDFIERGETGRGGAASAQQEEPRGSRGWSRLHETMKVMSFAGVGEYEVSGWVASCVMYGADEQATWVQECVPDEMRRYKPDEPGSKVNYDHPNVFFRIIFDTQEHKEAMMEFQNMAGAQFYLHLPGRTEEDTWAVQVKLMHWQERIPYIKGAMTTGQQATGSRLRVAEQVAIGEIGGLIIFEGEKRDVDYCLAQKFGLQAKTPSTFSRAMRRLFDTTPIMVGPARATVTEACGILRVVAPTEGYRWDQSSLLIIFRTEEGYELFTSVVHNLLTFTRSFAVQVNFGRHGGMTTRTGQIQRWGGQGGGRGAGEADT